MVQSKILFADRFRDVEVTGAGRVRVEGLVVDGVDRRADLQVVTGALAPGRLALPAHLRVPAGHVRTGHVRTELVLSSAGPVSIDVDGHPVGLGPEPTAVAVEPSGGPFDVVNNVGVVVTAEGYGADRGWLQRDEGQFDEPAEIFGWSGGSVLLRPAYLADVGLFDERLFLYYEDTDLSWRGRARGWRYRCEPRSVVRHLHAASSGDDRDVFRYHNERNRLVVLARNAPCRLATRAALRHPLSTLSYARHDRATARVRARAYLGFLALLPATIRSRRRLARRRTVSPAQIMVDRARLC